MTTPKTATFSPSVSPSSPSEFKAPSGLSLKRSESEPEPELCVGDWVVYDDGDQRFVGWVESYDFDVLSIDTGSFTGGPLMLQTEDLQYLTRLPFKQWDTITYTSQGRVYEGRVEAISTTATLVRFTRPTVPVWVKHNLAQFLKVKR